MHIKRIFIHQPNNNLCFKTCIDNKFNTKVMFFCRLLLPRTTIQQISKYKSKICEWFNVTAADEPMSGIALWTNNWRYVVLYQQIKKNIFPHVFSFNVRKNYSQTSLIVAVVFFYQASDCIVLQPENQFRALTTKTIKFNFDKVIFGVVVVRKIV